MINELMPDPIADETLNEWIELYNNESYSINVSGYIIGDDNDNDTLEGGLYNNEGTIIPAFGYAIITDDATRVYNNFNVSPYAVRLYVDDSSIGNGLSNDGETFYLYDKNKNLIDSISYNTTSEDLSFSFINGSWHKSEVTPGYNNNGTYYTASASGCDYGIEIILSDVMFDNPDNFTFRIRASKLEGTSTNITLRADIKDLYDQTIKEYRPFTNTSITRQKTSSKYTPNLEQGRSYIINTNLTTSCNDTDLSNNIDSRLFTIKGSTLVKDSNIRISKIYDLGSDDKARFGQVVRVRLEVYKGDTTKKSIAIWVENKKGRKASKQSKASLYENFENSTLTLPIQLDANCDNSLKNGNYYVRVQGLGIEDDEMFKVEDVTTSLCKKIYTEKKSSYGKLEVELLEISDTLDDKIESVLRLSNDNDKDIFVNVWSYVYRGSKSYSGEREGNMVEMFVRAKSEEIINLKNNIIGAEPGSYKYKILIKKNNQKTNTEIVRDITVNNKKAEYKQLSLVTGKSSPENTLDEDIAPVLTQTLKHSVVTVFESTDQKIKGLIVVFLVGTLILLVIVLLLVKSF